MNQMNPMGLGPFNSGSPPPPLPSLPPPSTSFWTAANVTSRLKDLHDTLNLARAMQKELEIFIRVKEREGTTEGEGEWHGDMSMDSFSEFMMDNQIEVEFQESMSLNTANAIMSKLRFQLEPFRVVTDGNSPWEEKSAECEQFDKIDKEADQWRAREIAKDIAQQKEFILLKSVGGNDQMLSKFRVEKIKEIAKLKAKEKKKLESELELVLTVEKLQELRSIRIQKLKKQGHFLPEEDDKFLERVRAAVEEEECQSMAAADMYAAKDAIAYVDESTKDIHRRALDSEEPDLNYGGNKESQDQKNDTENESVSKVVDLKESKNIGTNGPASDSVRTWDAYIRPGGRRMIDSSYPGTQVRVKPKVLVDALASIKPAQKNAKHCTRSWCRGLGMYGCYAFRSHHMSILGDNGDYRGFDNGDAVLALRRRHIFLIIAGTQNRNYNIKVFNYRNGLYQPFLSFSTYVIVHYV
ncbi:hypothetical protein DH2020_002097 [Rehmannia glutinosa]|uniref:Uncharacterized protein n=1 Tax=Rehmannia glutinosa TaxID=99300 RepID=A0ABR0XTC4_REHGL